MFENLFTFSFVDYAVLATGAMLLGFFLIGTAGAVMPGRDLSKTR